MNELKWSNEGGMKKEEKQFKKKIYQLFAPEKIFIRPICYFFADLVRFFGASPFLRKKNSRLMLEVFLFALLVVSIIAFFAPGSGTFAHFC